MIRESKEEQRDRRLIDKLKVFKDKLHSFRWYIQTIHFAYSIKQRDYIVHEYHPISLRSFIERVGLLPLRLIAKMFACIVRGVHAYNQTKMPLTRLSPGFIGVTNNLIPKLSDPRFMYHLDWLDDPLYIQSDDGLNSDQQVWNLSLIL